MSSRPTTIGKYVSRVQGLLWSHCLPIVTGPVVRTAEGRGYSLYAFLKGYIDADGHTPRDGQHYIVSVSRLLLEQVKVLAKLIGWWSSNIHTRSPSPGGVGGGVSYQIVLYSQYTPKGKMFGGREVFQDNEEHFTFDRIRTITRLPAEPVYDIMVDGSHNFIANGFVAHNTNYRYPAENYDRARAALGYFNQDGQREKGGYTPAEWGVIGRRLARLVDRHLPAQYEYKNGKLSRKEE